MTLYLILKTTHATCALLSVTGLVLRWAGYTANADWVRSQPARLLPHGIDSLFLVSGLLLATLLSQYPFVHDWLTAKVLALIVYIILGALALKRKRSLGARSVFLAGALIVYAYIIGVARTWNPLSWLTMV